MKRTYSIRNRILLFYGMPLLLIIVIIALFINSYIGNMDAQARMAFESMAEMNVGQLNAQIDEIKSAARDIAYSSTIQEYLVEQTLQKHAQDYRQYQVLLAQMIQGNERVRSAFVGTSSSNVIHCGDSMLYRFYDHDIIRSVRKNQYRFYLTRKPETNAIDGIVCLYGAGLLDPYKLKNDGMVVAGLYAQTDAWFTAYNGDVRAFWVFDDGTAPGGFKDYAVKDENTLLAGGDEWYYKSVTVLDEINLKYMYCVRVSSLAGSLSEIETLSIVLMLICVALMTLSNGGITRSLFTPVGKLCEDMDVLKVSSEKLPESAARELHSLTTVVNNMLERINESAARERELMTLNYEMQIQQKSMELQIYRGQINPHFLFNTLECINGMARYYDVEPISEMIMSLSDSFRYALNSPVKVALRDELTNLGSYLTIMKGRYPDRFTFRVVCDKELENASVPSLLLQPLVENAVTHAFEGFNKKSRPTICLFIQRRDGGETLEILVADNGSGINDLELLNAQLQDEKAVQKHALQNIRHRLRLLYGANCLSVSSKQGFYTRVMIVLPYSVYADTGSENRS